MARLANIHPLIHYLPHLPITIHYLNNQHPKTNTQVSIGQRDDSLLILISCNLLNRVHFPSKNRSEKNIQSEINTEEGRDIFIQRLVHAQQS